MKFTNRISVVFSLLHYCVFSHICKFKYCLVKFLFFCLSVEVLYVRQKKSKTTKISPSLSRSFVANFELNLAFKFLPDIWVKSMQESAPFVVFFFPFAYFKIENLREGENKFLKLKLYFNQSHSTLFYLPFFSLFIDFYNICNRFILQHVECFCVVHSKGTVSWHVKRAIIRKLYRILALYPSYSPQKTLYRSALCVNRTNTRKHALDSNLMCTMYIL